MAKLNVNLHLL